MKKQILTKIGLVAVLAGISLGTVQTAAAEKESPNPEAQCMCMKTDEATGAMTQKQKSKDTAQKAIQKKRNARAFPRAKSVGRM